MYQCGHCREVFHTLEGFLDHEDVEAARDEEEEPTWAH